jgi:DNA invertase Pin-like site-specific DNA recombinase
MNSDSSGRIKQDHYNRKAVIYIRQSSTKQLKENQESRRLQFKLKDKAILLGWTDPEVISDDLGITATGYSQRPGFQRLLSGLAMREIGIIFCYDASRLSRNSKDWAHLMELCGYFGTLISDLDQIYDLTLPNDRLLLGIKGTIAAMELTAIKQRMHLGMLSKASRGELKTHLPVGFIYDLEDKVVLDPDLRVQNAIQQLYDQFDKLTSLSQVLYWYRDNKIEFPIQLGKRHSVREILWKLPTYTTLRKALKNPTYAGAYVWGRTKTVVEFVGGALIKKVKSLPREQWQICILDHHPGYITWEKHLSIYAKLTENLPRWKVAENRGAINKGSALLAGLLRCHHCGSKLFVNYKKNSALYYCSGGLTSKGNTRCLSFGSKAIDNNLGDEIIKALSPINMNTSVLALEKRMNNHQALIDTAHLKVEASRYSAARAFEQYNEVDPKNRLVASTLETNWNNKLVDLNEAENELISLQEGKPSLSESQRSQLTELADNFPELWNHPKADSILKKRIIRLAINEVIVKLDEEKSLLEVIIHWAGGAHTKIFVKKHKRRKGGKTDPKIIEKVKMLAKEVTDAEIARILNMQGIASARGLRWNQCRVQQFRSAQRIVSNPRKPAEDILTFSKAHEYLGISANGLRKLAELKLIDRNQVTEFAPWRVEQKQLDSAEVQNAVEYLKTNGRLPKIGGPPNSQGELFHGK